MRFSSWNLLFLPLTCALTANVWICHEALTNCCLFCRLPMSSPAGESRVQSERSYSWRSSPHWQTRANCWDLACPCSPHRLILQHKLAAGSLPAVLPYLCSLTPASGEIPLLWPQLLSSSREPGSRPRSNPRLPKLSQVKSSCMWQICVLSPHTHNQCQLFISL